MGDFLGAGRLCASLASLARARYAARPMGKLLKKYAHGRGLPENAAHTAATYDEERRRRDEARRRSGGASTSEFVSRDARAIASSQVKRWKSRGGAKPRLMRALRVSAHGHRALTKQEVDALIVPVLQPRKAKYGGQGLAKPSTFVNIASESFFDEFESLFDEHIEGFNGKSYVKMGKSREDMLWKQKLREKRNAEDGFEATKSVAPVDDGEALMKRAKKKMKLGAERAAAIAPTPAVRVDADLQAQAIAAYRALKAKKAAMQTFKPQKR